MPTREKQMLNIKLGVVILLIVAILFTITFTVVQVVQVLGENRTAQGGDAPPAGDGSGNPFVVESGLFNVKITIPASMLQAVTGAEDAQAYASSMEQQDGVKSAEVNTDGSVTLTVTKDYRKTMVEQTTAHIQEMLQGYANGGGVNSSIRQIEYAPAMTKFSITVTRHTFELGDEREMAQPIAACGMYYQALIGAETAQVEVAFIDAGTGEVIESALFPAAFA